MHRQTLQLGFRSQRLYCCTLQGFVLLACLVLTGAAKPYDFRIVETNDPSASAFISADDSRNDNFNFLAYSVDMILDPCRGQNHDCCWDTFGSPEYIRTARVIPAGWVWALSQSGTAYKCQNPCTGYWIKDEDTSDLYNYEFDSVDTDETFLWALNLKEKTVFKRVVDGSGEWELISGNIKSLTASATDAVYGISRRNELLSCMKPCTGEWESPVEVAGHPLEGDIFVGPSYVDTDGVLREMVEIDGDATHIWVVLDTGELFMRRVALGKGDANWQDKLDDAWTNIGDTLGGVLFEHVTVSNAQDSIWASTDTGDVYSCTKPCLFQEWSLVQGDSGGGIASLDAGHIELFAVTESGSVVKRLLSDPTNIDWVTVPTNLKTEVDHDIVQEALLTIPAGGFKYISVGSITTIVDTFEMYTVERFARICSTGTDKELCISLEDEGCLWNDEVFRCELVVPTSESRLQDQELLFDDPTCIMLEGISSEGKIVREAGYALVEDKVGAELAVVSDIGCVADGVRQMISEDKPACWDHNATVSGDQSCYNHYLNRSEANCVNVGYTSTAYIVQCSAGEEDADCGTFIEVHRAGSEEVISEVKIHSESSLTSGYRTTHVSLLYGHVQGDVTQKKLLCLGRYELWWVQRTRKASIVEFVKKFEISSPLCDFDEDLDAYLPFRVVEDA